MNQPQSLQRSLGSWDLFTIGVGSVIGCGIFVLFATILQYAGVHTATAFLIAAIPNIIMAFSYSELATMYKKNATEYEAVRDAFGDNVASISTYLLVAFMIFNAATVLIFAGSFLGIPHLKFAFCLAILFVLSLVNYFGIDVSKKITTGMGFIEIVMLLVIIMLGARFWIPSRLVSYPMGSKQRAPIMKFWVAAFLALFLYNGFDVIVKLTEESKNPDKDVPFGLIGSVTMTTIIYVLLALTAVSVPIIKDIAASSVPITKLAKFVGGMGSSAHAITGIGWFILLNTFFIGMLSLSRFVYGLAKDGKLPAFLSEINTQYKTPHKAIITVFVIIAFALLIEEGEKAASMANIFYLIFMTIIHVSVIKLRQTAPDKPRPFRIPGNIGNIPVLTILGILMNCMFILASFCLVMK